MENTVFCDYPECLHPIRDKDKTLKPETSKFCESHGKELDELIMSNNVKKLAKFMLMVAFKNKKK